MDDPKSPISDGSRRRKVVIAKVWEREKRERKRDET